MFGTETIGYSPGRESRVWRTILGTRFRNSRNSLRRRLKISLSYTSIDFDLAGKSAIRARRGPISLLKNPTRMLRHEEHADTHFYVRKIAKWKMENRIIIS